MTQGRTGEPKCRNSKARRQGYSRSAVFILKRGRKGNARLGKLDLEDGDLGLMLKLEDGNRGGPGQGSRDDETRQRAGDRDQSQNCREQATTRKQDTCK